MILTSEDVEVLMDFLTNCGTLSEEDALRICGEQESRE